MSDKNLSFKKISVIKLSPNFCEATKVIEVPLSPPSDNQILIRNYYAGVNAIDISITAGHHFSDGKLPFNIGIEGLGVIEAVGKSVSAYEKGQIGLHYNISNSNAYAQFSYISPEEFLPLPDSRPEFLCLLISGLTASIGLDEAGRIKKGDKVLITAAAGGTGHIAVQWAKLKGCHVIGLCSTKPKEELLKQLGCDRVINYKEEIFDDVLNREYPEGIDVIWETIGGQLFETLLEHLRLRGRLVIIGGIAGYKSVGVPDVNIPRISTKLLSKSLSITGFALPTYHSLHKQYFEKLINLFLDNKLKIVIDFGNNTSEGSFNGIESIARAVEYLHSGLSKGKVIVKIES